MGRFLRQWLKILPLGVLLPIMLGAASVSPDGARSNLSEWAHWVGIPHVPQWIIDKSSDRWVIVISIITAIIYLLTVYFLYPYVFLRRRSPKPRVPGEFGRDFERVESWTVSFTFGNFVSIMGDNPTSYAGIQGCRFANISTTQPRVLDVSIFIPTDDPKTPPIHLTTLSGERPHTRALASIGAAKEGRLIGSIPYPIEVPPGAVVEGELEFAIHPEIVQRILHNREMPWINFFQSKITVHEHRSKRQITVRAGQGYNAATGRIIPSRRPSWVARLRLKLHQFFSWLARSV
jgi:hypothetical protein